MTQLYEVDITWHVRVPMRDGVHLGGMLYRPRTPDKVPAVFTITPYNHDIWEHPDAYYFAQRGIASFQLDTRGRGNSEGQLTPFEKDHLDCFDVCEWLAAQPWCSGQISMWGASYGGQEQWLTVLKNKPPHLKSILPQTAANIALGYLFNGPVRHYHMYHWLSLVSGRTQLSNLMIQEDYWYGHLRELYLANRPYRDVEEIIGLEAPWFRKWSQAPTHHAYWDQLKPSPAQFAQVDIPILSISGYYDEALRGVRYWDHNLRQYSKPETIQNNYLILGPWDHGGAAQSITPRETRGVDMGDQAIIHNQQLQVDWYRHTLMGGPKPEFLKNNFAYFVMGANRWKYAPSPNVADTHRRLYLNSSGYANDVFRSGWMQDTPPEHSPPDAYTYDPLDNRFGELKIEAAPGRHRLSDQRIALNLFEGGLVYHSPPFETATEVSGQVKLVLWIEMDVVDADFHIIVSEIMPHGSTMRLSEDMWRARYREGLEQEKLVTPGEVLRYEFDGFLWFSRLVQAGSRLRVVIKCPNSVFAQRNYCSGGVVDGESGKDAHTAHITLHHDAKYPSYLELPIVSGD